MAKRALTDTQLVERLTMRVNQGAAATAAHFGISAGTLRGQLREARFRGLTADAKAVDDRNAKLQTQVDSLTAELAAIERDNLSEREVREKIFGLAAITPDPPEWLHKSKPGKSSGVPMVLWSDWHYGEVVRPEEVGGVNEFNRAIGKKRVRQLVDTTIDLAMNHMTYPNYPGIVVLLGGDMISGGIHDELRETNEGPVTVALLEVAELLISGLKLLADKFGKVFVPCVVGNHGRTTQKPRAKHRVFENYEYILYCMVEKAFKDDPRVQFYIPEGADAHFAVYGHRFMLTHGDALGVKGGDGIIGSLGPIARGTLKVGRSEAQVGRDFDTLVICHWHNYIPRGEAIPVIVNGALKGYDEYAMLFLRARPSVASQAFWFVHPKYGITAQWQIKLQAERKTDAARGVEWVTWETRKVK